MMLGEQLDGPTDQPEGPTNQPNGPTDQPNGPTDQPNGPTQEEVDSLVWFHGFTFPNGVKAKGRKGGAERDAEEILRREAPIVFKYPVEGKTLLDIGAWNGYFSVEAVRRGAKRVVALDKYSWEHPLFQGFKGFDLVRRHLAPEIEAVTCDVMELRNNPVGNFDRVLFLGVLYHLKHPLYVLETLFDITGELLVVETALDMQNHPRPAMAFYPGYPLTGRNKDRTNWWGPNAECVVDMLKTVGFSRVEHEPHPQAKRRGFFFAFK